MRPGEVDISRVLTLGVRLTPYSWLATPPVRQDFSPFLAIMSTALREMSKT